MKLIRRSIALAVAALVSLAALPAKAESLGDMMRSAGWDRIFGTWVDADTQGAAVSISYGWKFKDKVVESTVKMGDRESYSLIGINATNGEVFHVGVDSDGGGSLGKWEADENGNAVLSVGYASADGESGSLKITMSLEDDDTLAVTVERESEGTMEFKLVRKK